MEEENKEENWEAELLKELLPERIMMVIALVVGVASFTAANVLAITFFVGGQSMKAVLCLVAFGPNGVLYLYWYKRIRENVKGIFDWIKNGDKEETEKAQ